MQSYLMHASSHRLTCAQWLVELSRAIMMLCCCWRSYGGDVQRSSVVCASCARYVKRVRAALPCASMLQPRSRSTRIG